MNTSNEIQEQLKRFLGFLQQDPSNINLLLSISNSYRLLNEFTAAQQYLGGAIKILEKLLETNGPTEQTLTLLAQLYFDNEEGKLAENAARQVLLINPDNYEAQVILLLLDLTHEKIAVSKIKKLMAREPNDCRLWFALGSTYFHSLKLQQAEKAHLKATELDPGFYDNWISLGWCELFLEQLEKAENCYRQALAIYEGGAEGWGGLALVSSLHGKFEEAESLIAKAKNLDANCLLANIAELYYLEHRNPEKVGMQFTQSFPTLAEQLNKAMVLVLEKMQENKTLH